MKRKLFQNKLIIKKSKLHGYGVFALKSIKKGEKIEECYFIISTGKDRKLEDFYFDAEGKYAFFTGFGSVYNHSEDPNADYTVNVKHRSATIKAIRRIKKDEEIYISYGKNWFKSRGLKPKAVKESRKKPRIESKTSR